MADFIDRVIDGLAAGEGILLATIVGPEGAPTFLLGRKLVVARDGVVESTLGSVSLDRRVSADASPIAQADSLPRLLTYELSIDEQAELDTDLARVELFLEPLVPAHALLIAGGGHIAVPLCAMGKTLGFSVTVVDDRPEFANSERFPAADRVIAGDFRDVLGGLPISCSSYVVIVTRGHSKDEEALLTVLRSGAAYVGMIGSSRKVKALMDHLRESGIPQEQLDRVYSPIGLDIAARTPAEIAVSILAEIIHVRRHGEPHPSSMMLRNKRTA